ncbi:DUF3592 domain-containing protein [Archangium sp.]|uniref:DUF3592 domain-containing protein n=1 Tax=Archangium sp. TaxID=1872627 RepID=UPI002EDA751E
MDNQLPATHGGLPPQAHLAIAVIVMAGGLFIATMGTMTYFQGRALSQRGIIADAVLTEVTHRKRDSDTGHQVGYRFTVGGQDFHRVGIFGTAVGSDVSQEDQEEAVQTGHLQIRYVPDDPWINEPVATARPRRQGGMMAVGIGLVMLLGGLIRFVLAREARPPRPQPDGGQQA